MNPDDKVFLQVFGSAMMMPIMMQSLAAFDTIPHSTKFTTIFGVSMLALSMIPRIEPKNNDSDIIHPSDGFMFGVKLCSYALLGVAVAKYLSSD